MAEEQTADARPVAPAEASAVPADRLTVTTTSVDGTGVLTPAGELDLNNTHILRQALDEAAATHSRIVLDLHLLTFMDSTGINLFITAHRTLTATRGWLRLATPTHAVLRVLQVVGVTSVIDHYAALHDALTAPSKGLGIRRTRLGPSRANADAPHRAVQGARTSRLGPHPPGVRCRSPERFSG